MRDIAASTNKLPLFSLFYKRFRIACEPDSRYLLPTLLRRAISPPACTSAAAPLAADHRYAPRAWRAQHCNIGAFYGSRYYASCLPAGILPRCSFTLPVAGVCPVACGRAMTFALLYYEHHDAVTVPHTGCATLA